MSAVLLDFPGVITQQPGEHARTLVEEAIGATGFWEEFAELRPQLLTGTIDEKRFYNRLAARAELPLFDVDDAIAADWAGQLHLDDDTVATLDSLRAAEIPLGVVADVSTGLSLHLRRHLIWLGGAVPAVLSCDIGLLTADPRTFAVAVDALHAPPEKTTFFSRIPEHLDAAREHGLTVREYTGAPDLKELLQ